jgi:hypothetical protein
LRPKCWRLSLNCALGWQLLALGHWLDLYRQLSDTAITEFVGRQRRHLSRYANTWHSDYSDNRRPHTTPRARPARRGMSRRPRPGRGWRRWPHCGQLAGMCRSTRDSLAFMPRDHEFFQPLQASAKVLVLARRRSRGRTRARRDPKRARAASRRPGTRAPMYRETFVMSARRVGTACSGVEVLGPWHAASPSPAPRHARSTTRVTASHRDTSWHGRPAPRRPAHRP